MKKYINLLHKNKKYQEKEKWFRDLRYITIVIGLVSIGLVFISYYINTQQDVAYKKLLLRKELYLRQLIQVKDAQNKVAYVNDATSYLQGTLQKDLNFSPYYSIIQQVIINPLNAVSSESASIEQFNFDNKQTFELKMKLDTSDSLVSFLKLLESETFLNYFKSIQLTKFATVNNNVYYEVTVKGVFKQFKDPLL